MARKNVLRIINLYKNDLEKKINVDGIILFGSSATNKTNKDSDIDLLVISSKFASLDSDERAKLLVLAREHPKTWEIGMDIFGVTQEEYDSASRFSILGEIKKTGVKVA